MTFYMSGVLIPGMANKLTRMTKLVAIKGMLRKKVTSLATEQTKIVLYFY